MTDIYSRVKIPWSCNKPSTCKCVRMILEIGNLWALACYISSIFVIDRFVHNYCRPSALPLLILILRRSGSMSSSDRRPLSNSPATSRIVRRSNNRLGAVYSSLDSFWSARHAAVTRGQQATARRDSYSVILFDHTIVNGIVNDFTSSPDQLLEAVLQYTAAGGTDFTAAIKHTQTVMEQNWSTER